MKSIIQKHFWKNVNMCKELESESDSDSDSDSDNGIYIDIDNEE